MKKRICLITPGHIASNPRLVKEAFSLHEAGMEVHIIFSQYAKYLTAHDKRILESNQDWTYEFLDWTGNSFHSKLARYFSGILQKLSWIPELKINRNFRWQLRKAISAQADLYIGHNLGALPVAVLAAKMNTAKSGFDAEDFHRYQVTNDNNDEQVKLVIEIENKYIPQVDYLTAAGEPIAQKYQELFKTRVLSISNVFPKQPTVVLPHAKTAPLTIFWFSQTVGASRGLEEAILAIGISGLRAELHLLGEIHTNYRQQLSDMAADFAVNCLLRFHCTIFPDDVFQFAEQFDIGLAIETGVPLNRDICLTNKIYTYIQSGLCIVASNTTAQCRFMEQYPTIGKTFIRGDLASLADVLIFYDQNRENLLETRKAALKLAQSELNWEKESQKFLNQVLQILNGNWAKGS